MIRPPQTGKVSIASDNSVAFEDLAFARDGASSFDLPEAVKA